MTSPSAGNQSQLIILGAGKPFKGTQHSALRGASGRRRVLDWLLQSMEGVSQSVTFVGGYQIQEVAKQYPLLNYIENPRWREAGPASSLLVCPLEGFHQYYVSYSDVLFRDSAVRRLESTHSDVAILVDRRWQSRFSGRESQDLLRCEKAYLHGDHVTRLGRDLDQDLADAEFVGLVRFNQSVADFLTLHRASLPENLIGGSLTDLLDYVRSRGFSIEAVDVAGDWAELNEPDDLSRFILGTKAQTLARLQRVVTHSQIEDQVSFTVREWQSDKSHWLDQIRTNFGEHDRLVVRSSALSEDGFGVSNAGAYTSVLNVNHHDESAVKTAVEEVIESYPDGNPDNQVLVQPMLRNVDASGVAFTKTLSSGAPYFVINYDDVSSSTESITSGTAREHKTLYVYRHANDDNLKIPQKLKGLLLAIREIEELLDFDSLDIEFALSGDRVHVLQVRPIAVRHQPKEESSIDVCLATAATSFEGLQRQSPFVLGESAVFGVMPDWNPAEIIGTRPGRLAAGLYRYLIMDDVWAAQRAHYGYRDVRPQPLLRVFAGHPYVDVRASFNSFIPASVPDRVAAKLVDFYLNWLVEHPHLHDKVEFEVVPTCFTFDFQRWRSRLANEGGFVEQEIDQLEKGLKAITAQAFNRIEDDMAAVRLLEERFERLEHSEALPLDQALHLLEDCKQYGTETFAHLARGAFVAISLLRSAVAQNILSQEAMDDFLNSIRTVSHEFTEDAARVARGEWQLADLVAKFGHLRPGTYDITSPCYADNPDQFLVPAVEHAAQEAFNEKEHPRETGKTWLAEKNAFFEALADSGLPSGQELVETFLRRAIEGREFGKFVFTRHLSAALNQLAAYGESHDISRHQLADISLQTFFDLRSGVTAVSDVQHYLNAEAAAGSRMRELAETIELPPLISRVSDFYAFTLAETQANYVGSRSVTAGAIALDTADSGSNLSLEGMIVLVPQADPGFDWLFGHGIAGLITTFGGANSHMAIRAAEFGLPAAIGVGEAAYERLASARSLSLDPVNKRIEVIR